MNQRVPRILDRRYELHEVIGSGGMATVYAAEDTRLGRQVAIKVLRPEHAKDATFRARFQREAEAVASLNHPSILAVYDTGVFTPLDEDARGAGDPDATAPMPALAREFDADPTVALDPGEGAEQIPYIVMELLHGTTLKAVMAEQGELPVTDAVSYTGDILDALAYSHDHGVIHRDIKPANVMVLDRDEEDESLGRPSRIKVMDFGIARALAETGTPLTEAHTIMGTARYIAPEQARGEAVDARSDLYSVGCLLYQMLAGRPPFDGETSVEVAGQHLSEQPVAPSAYRPGLPEGLDQVVLTALAKSRVERFQSAEEFRYALDNASHGIAVADPFHGLSDEEAPHGDGLGAAGLAAAGLGGAALGAGAASTASSDPGIVTGRGPVLQDSSYTTDTGTQPELEEAGVSGFFPQAQDEYSEDELYDNERNEAIAARRRRRNAWKNAILGLIILLLAATAAGAWMYYNHELNKTVYVGVPDVRQSAQEDAEQTLRNEGLKVTVEKDFDDTIPSGNAIKTDPRQGTQVEKDSTVTLVVSKGPAKLSIPEDFAGQSEAYVRSQLDQMGLVAGSVKTVNHPSIPAGMVVSTEPGAGQSVDNGSTVNLVLSSGKVTVPQLVGLSRDQAIAALTDKDVLLNTQIQTEHSSQPAGTVLSQSSAAGSSVAQGSTVTITISQGPQGTTTTASPSPSATPGAGGSDDEASDSPAGDGPPSSSAAPSSSAKASASSTHRGNR